LAPHRKNEQAKSLGLTAQEASAEPVSTVVKRTATSRRTRGHASRAIRPYSACNAAQEPGVVSATHHALRDLLFGTSSDDVETQRSSANALPQSKREMTTGASRIMEPQLEPRDKWSVCKELCRTSLLDVGLFARMLSGSHRSLTNPNTSLFPALIAVLFEKTCSPRRP
jgi:hypothetical protein